MWLGKCIPSSCVLYKRKPGKGLQSGPYLCLEALFALRVHAFFFTKAQGQACCLSEDTDTSCCIQQGPTVSHRKPCSVLCGSLHGREFGGEWIHGYCMDESLCCPPETITTLLIGCTPIQNKKLNKIKRGEKNEGTQKSTVSFMKFIYFRLIFHFRNSLF